MGAKYWGLGMRSFFMSDKFSPQQFQSMASFFAYFLSLSFATTQQLVEQKTREYPMVF